MPAFALVYKDSTNCQDAHRLKPGSTHERTQVRLPMGEWKIRINDKSPADIDWATFETIQAMLQDNCSEYDRNNSSFAEQKYS
jgi:hypothetical protein